MEQKEVLNKFLLKIIKNYEVEAFDCQIFISFLSVFFKKNIGSDVLVQQFEVYFCREVAYKINSFEDFKKEIKKDEKAKRWEVFKAIAESFDNHLKKKNDFSIEELANNLLSEINDILQKYKIDTKNTEEYIQPSFDNIEKEKTFLLTPTGGIKMLNNNPYEFFVRKVLNLQSIGDWNEVIDVRLYGTIIHEIMENFARKCSKEWITAEKINKELFDESCNYVFQKNDFEFDDFLKFKLKKVCEIAVELEKRAKKNNLIVEVEKKVGMFFRGLKFEARIDRFEIDKVNKKIYVYDFKTGTPPKQNEEMNGTKTQLLIIGFILSRLKEYENYKIEKLAYIELSGKNKAQNTSIEAEAITNVEGNLNELLSSFFNENKNHILPAVEKMFFIQKNAFSSYNSDIELMKFARCSFV